MISKDTWMVAGPHWPFSVVAYIFLMTLSNALIFGVAGRVKHDSIYYMTLLLSLGIQVTLITTVLKDPGIIRESLPMNAKGTYCNQCDIIRPNHAYHCPDCDVCINEYDHHCPWTSKCIGSGNITEFSVFCSVLIVYIVWTVFLTIGVAIFPDYV